MMYNFEQLRKDIEEGQVLLPGDEGYQESLQRWSAACVKNAGAVVKPTNAQEVSTAVKYGVENKIPFSVCGGGHSSSGTSSSEGMVIDLSKMRAVHVNTANMTVSFEGGCLWEDVDTALEHLGLATVGGVVNHTGVGGLTLGGGHGWLTPLHGLTIDNLISAQVVLADSSIIETSEEKDADLFWALRGAGAQFGVVTRFVSRVHKQDRVWSGTLAFSEDKLPEIVAVANDYYSRYREGEGHCLAVGIGYGPDGQTHGLSAIPCYHGPKNEAKKYFSKLLEIEAIATDTKLMSTAQMNTLLNPIFEHGIRRRMGSSNITMPVDLKSLQETARQLWDFCDSHPGTGTSVLAIEFFPTERIRAVPLEATAYANRGEYFDAMTAFGWSDPSLDQEIRQFNRKLCDQIRFTNGYNKDSGSEGPVGKYINVEADKIDPKDAYGVNLPRLRELKRRYDPGNVFNKWHGILASES